MLATQNPIEQEGTYPLPEAQQDRFMFKVFVGYPSYEEEMRIAEVSSVDIAKARESIPAALGSKEVMDLQEIVRRVPASRHVVSHALDLVRRTRPSKSLGKMGVAPRNGDSALPPEIIERMVTWGAGPRAVQFMVIAAKARAILNGRYHVSLEDVRAVAHPVLRHRIVNNFSAEAEGYTTDRIIDELLAATPAHESALTQDARLQKVLGS